MRHITEPPASMTNKIESNQRLGKVTYIAEKMHRENGVNESLIIVENDLKQK